MFVIFYLSHQPAGESNQLSKGITKIVAQNIEMVSGKEEINLRSFNNIIRDYAHFSLYFILGVILVSALKKFGLNIKNTLLFSINMHRVHKLDSLSLSKLLSPLTLIEPLIHHRSGHHLGHYPHENQIELLGAHHVFRFVFL